MKNNIKLTTWLVGSLLTFSSPPKAWDSNHVAARPA